MMQTPISGFSNSVYSGRNCVLILYFIHADLLDDEFILRLSASLRSLSPLSADSRIAVADYSTKPCIPDDLIKEYALEYIHQPAELPFNRSWSINFAFKHFVRDTDSHLLFTDLDLLFPPGFVEDVVATLATVNGILIPNVYYLDKDVCTGELDYAALLTSKSNSWREFYGGACLCPVKLFREVRGFDEQYVGWGAEDNDFINRIASVGGQVLKLPEFEVLHLDHPRTAEQQKEIVARNRRRLARKKSGEIPMIEQVPWGGAAPAPRDAHSDDLTSVSNTPSKPMERTEPAVSIILPVFNAGKYLAECIESLKAQTLRNVEFIFVDDCSTDNSPAILEEFRTADHRVQIHRLEHNSGPAVARNSGLDRASGRYVRFVDVDDIVPPASTQTLFSCAVRDTAEIVRGNCVAFRDGSEKPAFPARNIFQVTDQAGLAFRDKNFHGLPLFHQVFMFDRHFLDKHQLRYPALRIGEDPVFVLAALLKSVSASTVSEIVYYYRAHKSLDHRFAVQSEIEDYLQHYLLLKSMWLDEEKLADWESYLQANFWWFWKHYIDRDSQKTLLHYQKARQVLENIPDDQLTGHNVDIDWEIVKAVRDSSYTELADMLASNHGCITNILHYQLDS